MTKRDGDSSLMQLKEEFRTYENLRREHDTQIVQIATEGEEEPAGSAPAPDLWRSALRAPLLCAYDRARSDKQLSLCAKRTAQCRNGRTEILCGPGPAFPSRDVVLSDSGIERRKTEQRVTERRITNSTSKD